ncbi:MAG: chemotaxis protein CheD [Alicyclobacillus sp.]|nr:chemotaxis protein CheD [Alicyclobacillus sp.]
MNLSDPGTSDAARQELHPVVRIGIAAWALAEPPAVLVTTGLGSCVGVVLYDDALGVAAMAHVMLPTASLESAPRASKYADLAVPFLIQELVGRGAALTRLRAKFAGGAQMFKLPGKSDLMRIGPRNVEAVERALTASGIPIAAKDCGGSIGRTIAFHTVDRRLHVRTAKYGTYVL